MILLSVLDQSPVSSGQTPTQAVQATLELARAAERLGYHRYWLAEHHATPGLAGSTPEILVGRVAACTSRIRVGSGGVMLSHYSPSERLDGARSPRRARRVEILGVRPEESSISPPSAAKYLILQV